MNRRNIFVVAASFVVVAWAIAQQPRTSANSTSPSTETKVSESREKGKHQRTTEVFQEKVLLSRKQEVSAEGKLKYVFMKLFRGGEMTYHSCFYADVKRTIRSYYRQDKMIMQEGDEDGDGFFETMILFSAKEQPDEAFSKTKDGTVTQFSKEKLAELKKSFVKLKEE